MSLAAKQDILLIWIRHKRGSVCVGIPKLSTDSTKPDTMCIFENKDGGVGST